jgi:hypothetical protein
MKKTHILIFIISFFLLPLCNRTAAQNMPRAKHSSIFVSSGFFQIKEEENLGMVFNAPQISVGFTHERPLKNHILTYQNRIALGPVFSRNMMGAFLNVKPVDLFYGVNITEKSARLYLGPTVKIDYNFQIYPDLHSGFPFWFTDYHVGIGSLFELPLDKILIRMQLSTSLAGFISRPEAERDPYFFSLRFGDILSSMHQDFSFGSFNLFNNTVFELGVFPGKNNHGFWVSYYLEYIGYYEKPDLANLHHLIKINFPLKGKRP